MNPNAYPPWQNARKEKRKEKKKGRKKPTELSDVGIKVNAVLEYSILKRKK
jgi:hypothetical protein